MSSGNFNIKFFQSWQLAKIGQGNMTFFAAAWQLKIDIETLTDFLCIFHSKCVEFRIYSFYENSILENAIILLNSQEFQKFETYIVEIIFLVKVH